MNFLLANLKVKNSKLEEVLFDEEILKESAFGSKTKDITGIYYNMILIPIIENPLQTEDFYFMKNLCSNIELDEERLGAINFFLKNKAQNANFSLDIYGEISDENIDIFYSDGSFSKSTKQSSFAVCQLLKEDNENGIEEELTRKKFSYNTFSKTLENSTNNVGELSGINYITENFGKNQLQLIISDSEYSIKSFREWIYNWKNNGFKSYSKKPISNKDLIEKTFKNIQNGKIVLFKWTRGHNNNNFNEICDIEAKKSLGI